MRRTITIRLQLSKNQEQKLIQLADYSRKVWNEVNYLRFQQYKNRQPVDFKSTEKVVYNKYKSLIGAATVQQICRKNAEAWKSFFTLSKKKKDMVLPKWLKPEPPGYRNQPYWIIVRNDRYKIDKNKIVIKGIGKFGSLEIQYKGKLYLKGKFGRIEIVYNPTRRKWYAYIPVKVEEKLENSTWSKVPKTPIGTLSAGVDLGLNNLMSVYIENGKSFLVSGRPLKSIEFYWQKKISEYQSKLNKSKKNCSHHLSRMPEKAKLQAKHYINTQVRRTVKRLYSLGVSKIIIGYPKGIARKGNKGSRQNFLLSHVWKFNYIIERITQVAEEYGIRVIVVDESYTSQTCPVCGKPHKGARFVRGLYKCPVTGIIFNADLVGAFNILKKKKKTITPNLVGLLAQGRGNGSVARPGEPHEPKPVTVVGEVPQISQFGEKAISSVFRDYSIIYKLFRKE